MTDRLGILIQAILEKTTKEQLEKELQNIEKGLKPLKLKTEVDDKQLKKQLEDVSSSTGSAMKKATLTIKEYEQGIDKLVHSYKMKAIADDEFSKRMNDLILTQDRTRYSSEFLSLQWQRQESIVRMLEQADKNYQKTVDAGINTERRRQEELKKTEKQTRSNELAQKDLLNTIRGIRGTKGAFITDETDIKLRDIEQSLVSLDPASKKFDINLKAMKSSLKDINTDISIHQKKVQDAAKHYDFFGQSILDAGL